MEQDNAVPRHLRQQGLQGQAEQFPTNHQREGIRMGTAISHSSAPVLSDQSFRLS